MGLFRKTGGRFSGCLFGQSRARWSGDGWFYHGPGMSRAGAVITVGLAGKWAV